MTQTFERVPCTVVTGFLGAGKTTLIRNLLEQSAGRRIAIIVNEFGDVGIDGEILKSCGIENCSEEDVVELSNGCICCTVADDFVPALDKVLSRAPKVDHILIETSGLALPKPLVQAFQWPGVKSRVTVDGIVAVVDGPALAAGEVTGDREALLRQRSADTSIDHDDPVEQIGDSLDFMLDGDQRHVIRNRANRSPYLVRSLFVEQRGRFVQEQHLRLRRERGCDCQPLLHSLRERLNRHMRVRQVEPDLLKMTDDASRHLLARHLQVFQHECQFLVDVRHAKLRIRILKDVSPPLRHDRLVRNHRHLDGTGNEPAQNLQQRRLAAAARAEQQRMLSLAQRKRNASEQQSVLSGEFQLQVRYGGCYSISKR